MTTENKPQTGAGNAQRGNNNILRLAAKEAIAEGKTKQQFLATIAPNWKAEAGKHFDSLKA